MSETATRIRATRVDAEDLIDRMLQETVISDNGSEDRSADRGIINFAYSNYSLIANCKKWNLYLGNFLICYM